MVSLREVEVVMGVIKGFEESLKTIVFINKGDNEFPRYEK